MHLTHLKLNIRDATILGLVGAGGIGYYITKVGRWRCWGASVWVKAEGRSFKLCYNFGEFWGRHFHGNSVEPKKRGLWISFLTVALCALLGGVFGNQVRSPEPRSRG